MKAFKLGDICEMNSGGTPRRGVPGDYDGSIKWAKISDIEAAENGLISETEETITPEGLASINNRIFPENTLLLAMYGSVGKTAITTSEMSTNQAILGIRPKNGNIDLQYLKYWFETIKKKLLDRAVGGTLQNISLTIVKDLEIPLPPLPLQQKIVAILDKADSLRQKDKQLLELFDDLAQSVFYEMFGDPNLNTKDWPIMLLGEVGSLDRGVSKNRPRNSPELLGGPYPLIQTGDIANSDLYLKSFSSTYSELGLAQSKMWLKGTLCITIAANIGKTAILNFNACFPDSIVGFVSNSHSNPLYIKYWFNHIQSALEESAPEAAQKNINLQILRNLKIPVPPLNLQNKFAGIIEKINVSKEKAQHSESKSESLFQSLLQRAFKGELVS